MATLACVVSGHQSTSGVAITSMCLQTMNIIMYVFINNCSMTFSVAYSMITLILRWESH